MAPVVVDPVVPEHPHGNDSARVLPVVGLRVDDDGLGGLGGDLAGCKIPRGIADEALLLGSRIVVLGSAPGRVIADLPVPFGFPRSRRHLFDSRAYVELEERIAAHYRQDIIERLDRRDVVAGPAERI